MPDCQHNTGSYPAEEFMQDGQVIGRHSDHLADHRGRRGRRRDHFRAGSRRLVICRARKHLTNWFATNMFVMLAACPREPPPPAAAVNGRPNPP